jgi:hypothetical protein
VKDLQTLICAEMKLEQSKQEVCVHLLPVRALTGGLTRSENLPDFFLKESVDLREEGREIVMTSLHSLEESKGAIELFTRERDCDSFEGFTSADAQHVLRWFDVDKGVRVEILTEDATISRQLQAKLKVEVPFASLFFPSWFSVFLFRFPVLF